MTVNLDDYRRRREEDPDRVKCARCGRLIAANATRCEHCGVFFEGEAFEFLHESERPVDDAIRTRRRALVRTGFVVTAIVATGLLISSMWCR